MNILEEKVNLKIADGQTSASVSFTPPSGMIAGCCVFTNKVESPGFVTAKITDDAGFEISPATDIRNYRDREAGYYEGKKPLNFQSKGKTLVFSVFATEPFAGEFIAQLVLVYQPNPTPEFC